MTSKQWNELLQKKMVKNKLPEMLDVRALLKKMADHLAKTSRLPRKVKTWKRWIENAVKDLRLDESESWVLGLSSNQVVSLAASTILRKGAVVSTRASRQQEPDQVVYINMVVSSKRGAGKEALQRLIRVKIHQMRQGRTRGPIAVLLNFAPSEIHLWQYYVNMGFSELKNPWTGYKSYVSQVHERLNRFMVKVVP